MDSREGARDTAWGCVMSTPGGDGQYFRVRVSSKDPSRDGEAQRIEQLLQELIAASVAAAGTNDPARVADAPTAEAVPPDCEPDDDLAIRLTERLKNILDASTAIVEDLSEAKRHAMIRYTLGASFKINAAVQRITKTVRDALPTPNETSRHTFLAVVAEVVKTVLLGK